MCICEDFLSSSGSLVCMTCCIHYAITPLPCGCTYLEITALPYCLVHTANVWPWNLLAESRGRLIYGGKTDYQVAENTSFNCVIIPLHRHAYSSSFSSATHSFLFILILHHPHFIILIHQPHSSSSSVLIILNSH